MSNVMLIKCKDTLLEIRGLREVAIIHLGQRENNLMLQDYSSMKNAYGIVMSIDSYKYREMDTICVK